MAATVIWLGGSLPPFRQAAVRRKTSAIIRFVRTINLGAGPCGQVFDCPYRQEDVLEYLDSEEYRDDSDSDNGDSFVIKGRTDDGQVIVEMDIDTEAHELLLKEVERTGKTVSELVAEIMDTYCAEVIRDAPHLLEIMEFREAFGPGLED
jgi:hypothetical protein